MALKYLPGGSNLLCSAVKQTALIVLLWVVAGHQSDVDVVQWHPNSHYMATGSSDRSIRLWDIRDASTARVFVGHRLPVSFAVPH